MSVQDPLPTPYQDLGSDESIFDRLNRADCAAKLQLTDVEPDYVDCQLLAESVRQASLAPLSLVPGGGSSGGMQGVRGKGRGGKGAGDGGGRGRHQARRTMSTQTTSC